MADGTIELQLVIDGKDVVAQVKRTALDKLPREAEKAGEKSGKQFGEGFGSSVKTVLAVAAGNIIASGIGRAISSITSEFRESIDTLRGFSRGVAEINSLLPDTSRLTSEVESALIGFSNQFGQESQAQARAFYQIVSAGVQNTGDQLAVLAQSNKAATAGLVDINTAADALTTSINSYAQSGLTARQASDALFQAVVEGKTTFGELGFTIGRVASIAQSAGIEFSEITGSLAFLTKSGIRTDEAVVGLRQAIVQIIKPADEAKKLAKQLGIEFNSSALGSKGLVQFFKELKTATNGNIETLTKLFPNVRALSAVSKIATGDIKDFERILKSTAESAGATDRALLKIQESLDFKIQKFGQEFANIFLVIQKAVFKTANEIGSFELDVFSLINTFITFAEFIDTFFVKPIAIALDVLRVAFNGITGAINSVLGGLVSLVAKAGPALSALGVSDETIESIKILGETFKESADQDITDAINTINNGFTANSDVVKKLIQNIRTARDEVLAFKDIEGGGFGAGGGGEEGSGTTPAEAQEDLKGFSAGFARLDIQVNKSKESIIKANKAIAASVKANLVGGISRGIQGVTNALIQGENIISAFGNAILATFGDLAVQLGTILIGTGVGIEATKALGGAAAIAAGVGLVAIGTLLKSFSGGGGATNAQGNFTGGAPAGTDGGFNEPTQFPEEEERSLGQTVSLTVNGDVFDSQESGLRILDILENAGFASDARVVT